MCKREVNFTLDTLRQELLDAEEEQREVVLSRRSAEALLEIAREGEFANWHYGS